MNVLVTSAGRRTSLVQAFVKAAEAVDGRVFAGDLSSLAPALYLAHRGVPLPRVDSAEYIPHLLSLAEEHQIKLVVPTIDTELAVLAQNADAFREVGAAALISEPAFIDICGDKWLTYKAFAEAGVDTAASWLPDDYDADKLPEHLFVKPRDGSASRDIYSVPTGELARYLPRVPNVIIQEELSGHEITIDALLDLTGRPLHYVPRRRIRTLAGESIQGITLPDGDLRDWLISVLNVLSKLGARGAVTLQAFLTGRGPVLTEVNPRFGGGFPLAYAAGGKYPDWLMAMLRGEEVPERFGEYQVGLYMTRYNTEYFTAEPLWSV